MRSLSALLGALFLLGIAQVAAAESSAAPPPIRFPKRDEVVRYERLADIPENYLNAIRKVNRTCINDESLRHLPALLFRAPLNGASSGLMLLATCESVVAHSYILRFLSPSSEPEIMSFPIMSFPAGFGATRSPGFLEWNAESQTLTARQGSDVCPDVIRRYTYQLGFNLRDRDALPSWRLLKVEDAPFKCIDDVKWEVVWEAAHWPVPQRPK